jgi:hypothetical protein
MLASTAIFPPHFFFQYDRTKSPQLHVARPVAYGTVELVTNCAKDYIYVQDLASKLCQWEIAKGVKTLLQELHTTQRRQCIFHPVASVANIGPT